jgi:hypothetical protein
MPWHQKIEQHQYWFAAVARINSSQQLKGNAAIVVVDSTPRFD